jgi:inner membrane protein
MPQDHCEALNGTILGVRLIEPVDVYLMSERSVKYGFLFVFLTFGAFFLFEALKRVGSTRSVRHGGPQLWRCSSCC